MDKTKSLTDIHQPDNVPVITKKRIAAGLRAGLIRLIDSPHNDGTVCSIGENWFYFGGNKAAQYSAEEYQKRTKEENIINEIYNVLHDFSKKGLGFEDEHAYYSFYLQEHGI